MSDVLQIVPQKIEFRNLNIGEEDSIVVTVTNISKRTRKVRFISNNPQIKLQNICDFTVTPGLTIKNTLIYTASSQEELNDRLKILTEDNQYEIPIISYPQLPDFSIGPKQIDFGDISLSSLQTRPILLKNNDSIPQHYRLKVTNEYAKLSPSEGTIEGDKKEQILVSFTPPKPGFYEFSIMLDNEETLWPIEPIHITANVIDQSIDLLEDGKSVEFFDFGDVFWGQTIKRKITVRNNCHIKRTFIIEDAKSIKNNKNDISYFKPSESEMEIEGFQQKDIIITLSSKKSSLNKEGATEILQSMEFKVKNSVIKASLMLKTSLSSLDVLVTPLDFNFEVQEHKTSETKVLQLQNLTIFKIPFEFKECSGYYFKPLKGVLKEKETKEIQLTFNPKSLGIFNEKTIVSFCGGVFRKPILLSGEAVTRQSMSPRPPKKKENWQIARSKNLALEFPPSPFSMTLPDLRRKETLKRSFRDFITDSAENRASRREKTKFYNRVKLSVSQELNKTGLNYSKEDFRSLFTQRYDEMKKKDESNFDLEYGEGLIPPSPPMLSTFNRIRDNDSTNNLSPLSKRFERKPKIKTHPTTKLEIMETARELTSLQQLQITPSAEEIDFGKIPIFSVEKRELVLTNNLTQNIFCEFHIDDPNFEKTEPRTQVIFPQKSGSFMIAVQAEKAGVIDSMLNYTINGTCQYFLHIHAEIVPLELIFPTEELLFHFSPEKSETFMIKTFSFKNPTSSNANFKWSGLNEFFSIKPISGICKANSSFPFEIIYRPNEEPSAAADAVLSVVGGPQRHLKLIGEAGNPKLVLEHSSIDFGIIPVGIEKIITVNMKNEGFDPGLFTIYPRFTDIMNISSETNNVIPGEAVPLNIKINCTKEGPFSIQVSIICSGTHSLTLDIYGKAEAPSVDIEYDDSLDVGNVYVGDSITRRFKIKNPGTITSLVLLDFTKNRDFSIKYPPKYDNNNGNCITVVKDKNEIMSYDIQEVKGKQYKMSIVEHGSVEFDLVFRPTIRGRLSLDLPFESNTIKINSEKPLTFSAVALAPPVEVSKLFVDFGVTTISQDLNPNIHPGVREIKIFNKGRKNVNYRIDMSRLDSSFTIEKGEGVIGYGLSQTIFIVFKPKGGTLVNAPIFVYATEEGQEEHKCAEIMVTAIINSRPLRLSQRYVALPTVPINVTVEKTIYLENAMSEETEIKVIVPVNENTIPLSVTLPEGSTFKHTTKSIPIKISFCSPTPISFSTQIAVLDTLDHSLKFTVSASADNSLFSLEQFWNNNECTIEAKNKSLKITKKDDVCDDFLSYISSITDIIDYDFTGTTYARDDYVFITNLLNAGMVENKIEDLAQDLAESNGNLLLEAFLSLAGPKSKMEVENLMNMNKETEEGKISKLKSILTCLISYGATLSGINPANLVPKQSFLMQTKKKLISMLTTNIPVTKQMEGEFNRFVSTDMFQQKLNARMKKFDELYVEISRASWLEVVQQMLKVLLIPKIDFRNFNSIPGVSQAMNIATSSHLLDGTFSENFSSNCISSLEHCILKWLKVHIISENGKDNVPNSFLDLRNPFFFGLVLKRHLYSTEITLIENNPTYNAEVVAKLINTLGFGYEVTPEMILDGSPLILCIISFQLMNVLPHYIPNSVLEFKSEFNKTCSQSVVVHNPSATEIYYHVNIKGSSNFTSKAQTIVVKPNQSAECVVVYSAKTHIPEEATLSLTPAVKKVTAPKSKSTPTGRNYHNSSNSDIPSPVSSIIMKMKSEVEIVLPSEVIDIEGFIYQPKSVELTIPNLCKVAGKYSIKFKTFKASDEYEEPLVKPKDEITMLNELIRRRWNRTSEEEEAKQEDEEEKFEDIVNQHQTFIFDQDAFEFDEEKGVVKLDFVPISLGKFRCFVLFSLKDKYEFVVEINGTTQLFKGNDGGIKAKGEALQETVVNIPLEFSNKPLVHTLVYGQTKKRIANISEVKANLIKTEVYKTISSLYEEFIPNIKFAVTSTLDEIITPEETKLVTGEREDKPSFNVTFAPQKPGNYTSTIILIGGYDVRSVKFIGTAIAPTKNITLEMETNVGKEIVQELPFFNPSTTSWNFSVSLPKGSLFTCPKTFEVGPNQTYMFPLKLNPPKPDKFQSKVVINNVTKQCSVEYCVNVVVTEPFAEDTLRIEFHAKDPYKGTIELPSFINNGTAVVESDIDIIDYPKEIEFISEQPKTPFNFVVNTDRSKHVMGSLIFTEPRTGKYIWYIVDINVLPPFPTAIINVKATQRERVFIPIPISNNTDQPSHYTVEDFGADDITGHVNFVVPANTDSFNYTVEFQSFTSFARESKLRMVSEELGEFIYILSIEVVMPSIVILAPMTATIGQCAKTYVILKNPLDEDAHFTVKSTDEEAFYVKYIGNIVVHARTSENIEIVYEPSLIGIQQSTIMSFSSPQIGDYLFKISGTGKPALPSSPTIVESLINDQNSGYVIFKNPFHRPTNFSVSLCNNNNKYFRFFNKRNSFTLNKYQQKQQISFVFESREIGQFSSSIVVTTMPSSDNIEQQHVTWEFPLVGICSSKLNARQFEISCRAKEVAHKEIPLELPGEDEDFDANSYKLSVRLNNESCIWMLRYIEVKILGIERIDNRHLLKVSVKVTARKQLEETVQIIVKNRINQTWEFPLHLIINQSVPCGKIVISEIVNQKTTKPVILNENFTKETEFYSYFLPGCSDDLSLSTDRGVIQPTLTGKTKIPVEVICNQKQYGNISEGVLMIETEEAEYVINVQGKIPEYTPPVIKSSLYSTEAVKVRTPTKKKKRILMKENIAKPKTPRRTFRKFE